MDIATITIVLPPDQVANAPSIIEGLSLPEGSTVNLSTSVHEQYNVPASGTPEQTPEAGVAPPEEPAAPAA